MRDFRLDDTDRRILRALLRDARQPVAGLARRLGLSESAVRHRIERLVKHGIIRRFTISLDYDKLGKPLTVIVGVNVGGLPGPKAALELEEVKEAVDIFTVTGEFDLIMRIVCSDIERFEQVVERIRAHDFVERTRSFVVLKKIRDGASDQILQD